MSNQIGDDEIEQLGNEVAILETALCVNSAIVGDLLIGRASCRERVFITV